MTLLRLFLLLIVFTTLTFSEVRSYSNGRWAEEPAALNPQHLRSHFREANNLTPLSEDELETLLFLLDKVRPAQGPAPAFGGPIHERRNKRTGHGEPHKQAVDWSNYFGIDKRSIPASALAPNNFGGTQVMALETPEEHKKKLIPPETQPEISQNIPEMAHEKKKEEALKEFYKSMAMATNMKKRKRSVAASSAANDLATNMKAAGDKLIWDALKLTGSQKDQQLSKADLAKLKSKLIQEIGAAYNIEKLRQFLKQTVGQ